MQKTESEILKKKLLELVESATMSGALGSFALTGNPDPEHIQGYFFLHPDQKAKTQNVPHPLAKK